MASQSSASLPEPPDSASPAPAATRARLYALEGGALMLVSELEERSHASHGDGVELQAEASAAAAAARAGDSLLLVVLQEEHVLHAWHLSFAEAPPLAEQEESLQEKGEESLQEKKGEESLRQNGEEPDKKGDTNEVEEDDDQKCAEDPRLMQKAEDLERHLYSLKLRIWHRSLRLHLLLFDKQNWILTRQYSICYLSNEEMELLREATEEKFLKGQTYLSSVLRSEYEGMMVPSLNVSLFVESKLRPSLNDFQKDQFLGKGASCNVILGNYCYDHNNYAIKVMKLGKNIQDEPREVSIQSYLSSAYIVRFSQAWIGSLCSLEYERNSDSYSSQSDSCSEYESSMGTEGSIAESYLASNSFEELEDNSFKRYSNSSSSKSLANCKDGLEDTQNECLCISMEFCPRTLGNYLSLGSHKCDVEKSVIIFKELTKGLKHLHDAGIVHRDLKPTNVFFGLDGGIKIAEFGHSCFRPECSACFEGTPNRGTRFYAAPELITGHNTSEKADIYSLGIIYLQLFNSFRTAYDLSKTFMSYRNDVDSQVKWKEGNLALFKQMTSENPKERPSAADILQDYISKGPSSS